VEACNTFFVHLVVNVRDKMAVPFFTPTVHRSLIIKQLQLCACYARNGIATDKQAQQNKK